MKQRCILLSALLLVPLATSHASDTPEPPVEVTQQMLNAIHTQPKLIFNPFPAYSEKYLPFAMASSIESTQKGRLWTCWAAGEDGPNAFLVASYSDDQGKTKAAPAREYLTAFLSPDDGKTWPAKLLLDERRTISYPDIAQAPNGDIYVHYDRNRYSDAEILFARFREEDVRAGKLVSKDAALKNVVKSKLGMNHGSSGR
jgi:hypothetical protein